MQPGDTLSKLAWWYLDDPSRWPEIFELNRDRPQPYGRKLTNPDLILIGWTLLVPDTWDGEGCPC